MGVGIDGERREAGGVRDDDRALAVLDDAHVGVEHGVGAAHPHAGEKRGGDLGGQDAGEKEPGVGRIQVDDAAGDGIAGAGDVEFGDAGERGGGRGQGGDAVDVVVDGQGLGEGG